MVKAYTTRVGSGPFVTELKGKIGNKIRKKGAEFGTTTGRPRRVGWLDLPLIRTAEMLNNFSDIAITKLDVLSGLKTIKVCTAYQLGKKKLLQMPVNASDIEKCKPIYKTFKGFEMPKKITCFNDLPMAAIDYLHFIQTETAIPIKIVSYGPKRSETLDLFG